MKAFTPIWRTATREQAIGILQGTREVTDSLIDNLSARRLTVAGPLGGGVWSIKDLIGHLATWEERALVILGARKPASGSGNAPQTTDERWLERTDIGGKRSALGLVLGKLLTGEKYGYYAHDLAHYKDLKRAVMPSTA
ncbi:MAG: DinB family protein, partial [Actinobacteria bacterium]|nr:DinB family protein [Actinomycetota bacterium]